MDARGVRGAATVTGPTGVVTPEDPRGQTFALVDTMGLVIAVVVVTASVSGNAQGDRGPDRARGRAKELGPAVARSRLQGGVARHCRQHHIAVEAVNKIRRRRFDVLPRHWVASGHGSVADLPRRCNSTTSGPGVITEAGTW